MNLHLAHLAAAAWASGGTLRRADLRGANLRGANLRGADLGGADLRGADLVGDTLAAYVTSADRRDYEFRLFHLADGSHKVMAGCRWMTVDGYRAHVAAEYPGTDKARDTLSILDYFESVIQTEPPK
ncbi:MAG: pentapeptide repeat-containing protein [Pseudomonadota bacterium]